MSPRERVRDARALARLAVDGVHGITDLVEQLHGTIAALSPPLGDADVDAAPPRTRGIARLVYRSVRGITRAVGAGLDAALHPIERLLAASAPDGAPRSPRREALVAALNGVVGDHLAASGNPLALPMRLHRPRPEATGPDLLVLVHGLCMDDLGWRRDGRDLGEALADALDLVPLYLHYNTGLAIADNGRALADTLEALLADGPAEVRSLRLLGHSMGGLVIRGALAAGLAAGHAWPARVAAIACLGTPHLGAPLERAGRWVERMLAASPYTAPFARLGRLRSRGVRDLRHGHVLASDAHDAHDAAPPQVPLPRGLRCYLLAGTTRGHDSAAAIAAHRAGRRLPGDGLVPVASALGEHPDRARALRVPAARKAVLAGHDHFDLLGSAEVFARLRRWFAPPRSTRPRARR